MQKEDREKYLRELANSNQGQALKEYFEELIEKLIDARNFKGENFEIEGKASIKAVAILERILRDLELLKRSKRKTIQKNQYI